MKPYSHGVANFRNRFCTNNRQFDLRESRPPNPHFQQNLLPPAHRLWVYVSVFSLGLIVMMAMVVMAMDDGNGDGDGVDNGDH